MEYNPKTGAHRIVLVDGDPVPADDCGYAVLSFLCEDSWVMEEVARPGNLLNALAESNRRTRSDTKSAVEERLRPLIDEQVLVDAACDSVDVTDLETGGRGIDFAAKIQKPGESPQTVQVQLGGT